MKNYLFSLIISLLLSSIVHAEDKTLQAKSEHSESKQIGWDYSPQNGPKNWGKLDPAFVLAAIGGSQSPIDIQHGEIIKADLPSLNVEAHLQHSLHILNNGHTLETICPGAATLHFGKHEYELRQFHFHAPSEHTINGKHAKLEMHFVHVDKTGHLAVVAVLFEEGEAEHPEIADILTHASLSHTGDEIIEEADIDIRQLLPGSLEYYTYDGSLTTPPATEGVRWFVLKHPLHLTHEQIVAIEKVYYSNNRPTQPLNARFVLTGR